MVPSPETLSLTLACKTNRHGTLGTDLIATISSCRAIAWCTHSHPLLSDLPSLTTFYSRSNRPCLFLNFLLSTSILHLCCVPLPPLASVFWHSSHRVSYLRGGDRFLPSSALSARLVPFESLTTDPSIQFAWKAEVSSYPALFSFYVQLNLDWSFVPVPVLASSVANCFAGTHRARYTTILRRQGKGPGCLSARAYSLKISPNPA